MARKSKTTTVQQNSENPNAQDFDGGFWFGVVAFVGILLFKALSGKSRRKWKTKRSKNVNEDGYVRESSLFGSGQLEHRAVAERILNRRLKNWEVVHHINGRRSDNRPENLCVMGRDAHEKYHKWYDWIHEKYGKYPRRETQLRKLKEYFGGTLLMDILEKTGS